MFDEELLKKGSEDSTTFHGNVEVLKSHLHNILIHNINLKKNEKVNETQRISELKTQKLNYEVAIKESEGRIKLIQGRIDEVENSVLVMENEIHHFSEKKDNEKPKENEKEVNNDVEIEQKEVSGDKDVSSVDQNGESNNQKKENNNQIAYSPSSKDDTSGEKFKKYHYNKITISLGFFICIVLTLFLYFFYILVLDSAIFRDRGNDNPTIGREFDTKKKNLPKAEPKLFYTDAIERAFSKDYYVRLMEFPILLFGPFVFLALSFSIHMYSVRPVEDEDDGFYRQNLSFITKDIVPIFKRTGFILLFVIVGVLDFVLAYHIVRRNHQLTYERAFAIGDKSIKPWSDLSLTDQIINVDFGVILLLGFVSYLILGFLFRHLMSQISHSQNIKESIKRKKEGIKKLKDNIREIELEKTQLENEISRISHQVEQFGKKIVLDKHLVKFEVVSYTKGWIEVVSTNGSDKNTRERLFNTCLIVRDEFLKELDDSSNYINETDKEENNSSNGDNSND